MTADAASVSDRWSGFWRSTAWHRSRCGISAPILLPWSAMRKWRRRSIWSCPTGGRCPASRLIDTSCCGCRDCGGRFRFFYVPVFSRLIGHPIYNWVAGNRSWLSSVLIRPRELERGLGHPDRCTEKWRAAANGFPETHPIDAEGNPRSCGAIGADRRLCRRPNRDGWSRARACRRCRRDRRSCGRLWISRYAQRPAG